MPSSVCISLCWTKHCWMETLPLTARVVLTAAAKSASPSLSTIPKPAVEDDAPPMDSKYPSLNAEEWQEGSEPEDDPSLHISASEQIDENGEDLPSFLRCHGEENGRW